MSSHDLSPHDLLSLPGDPPVTYRVLWVDWAQGAVATIETTDPRAWPRVQPLDEVCADLESGALLCEPFAEYRDFRRDDEIEEAQRLKRDADCRVIGAFVQDVPACFAKRARTAFVARAMEEWKLSRPTVVRILQDHWRGGMNPNALLPKWHLRGGRGKPRAFSGARLGRPRDPVPEGMEAPPPGMNVTEDERRFFAIAIDGDYAVNRRLSLRTAYDRCVATFFADRVPDPDRPGRMRFVPREGYAATGWPTFGQFRYWVERDSDLAAAARRRQSARVYDLRNRGLGGTASAEAWGPGSRFEIDATVADIYLRSRLDRNQLIGRPVIYVVIDVFSRLIVGVYVGLEGPSWAAAMMALANAVADKKAYCASIGIDIEDEEWPAHHLPSILLGDRGELESTGIATILKNFHVTCENAAAWRPDWKGIVESRFRILQQGFKAYAPGYVDVDFRARGARDYRGDAVLTLDEFERIIVRLVLYFNNHHELKTFDRHRGMVEDRVDSVPVDIWNWGIASVGGLPKSPAAERVRYALMPRASAMVTDRGILFEGRFYQSPRSMREGWSEKARTKGRRRPIVVAFDRRDVERLYLPDPAAEFGFEVATLTKRSREVAGVDASAWEAEGLAQVARAMSRRREQDEQLRRAEVVAANEAEVREAAAIARARHGKGTLASQVKGARANRAGEKAARRAEEAEAFRPDQAPARPSAEIHVLGKRRPSGQAARPSYASLRKDKGE